jgi:Integrase core domain
MLPQYREALTVKKKSKLLDAFTATTGYNRKYAMWLLNHAGEGQHAPPRPRRRHYGPEVQHALFLVWHAANRICAKRLMPFLRTLVVALERHEHLHISEECRNQLLSMSAATADRLLRSQRKRSQRGLSTTRAGTLLKQQIPIRTFQEWEETRPGFLEADLVAHCGGDIEGGYLYTLTLTDVATGWTECLPLMHRSQDAVLAALQRARTLFPFPMLGIDTDNGGEFINESMVAYCEQEHITFSRGRPYQKRDQCFVEQKNGAIVRQVVGYDRLVGERAYRQLTELYRALRLYSRPSSAALSVALLLSHPSFPTLSTSFR